MVRILMPILVAANQDRWDAFLTGPYFNVPVTDLPPDKRNLTCLRFYRRPFQIRNTDAARRAVLRKLEDVGQRFEFGITSALTDPETGYEYGGYGLGVTTMKRTWRKTKCWISFDMIDTLLNPQVTVSEKLLARFQLAGTILHECTVSLTSPNST